MAPINPLGVALRTLGLLAFQWRASDRAARRNRPRLWALLRVRMHDLSYWNREQSSRWRTPFLIFLQACANESVSWTSRIKKRLLLATNGTFIHPPRRGASMKPETSPDSPL